MSDADGEGKVIPPSPGTFREWLGGEPVQVPAPSDPQEGEVVLGEPCTPLPERLLLHHAEGKVLFLAGAGVSMPEPACLPSFTDLVLKVYKQLGDPVLPFLEALAGKKVELPKGPPLKPEQQAEVKSFEKGQLDVVLGMLERRIDGQQAEESRMRQAVVNLLQPDPPAEYAGIHRDLLRLSDRGGATAILTTNFDLLLEAAAKEVRCCVEGLALGAIPRPSLRPSFSGVLHLHGALSPGRSGIPDLILSNRDFGEFYLRRRIVPDLLYDAARIYHLVLVGYTANDPPVRYLLDAISADDARFPDLKERFIFVPFGGKEPDETELADWKARGLTPIPYSRAEKHQQLAFTLETWANLFEKAPSLGGEYETVTEQRIGETLERITAAPLIEVSDEDRSLFDHLIRREVGTRPAEVARRLGKLGKDYEWLDRILEVVRAGIVEAADGDGAREQPPSEVERRAAHCVRNFALDRLEEQATIEWARQLSPADGASHRGLKRLLSRTRIWEEPLSEPWATAWQMVEESWRSFPHADGQAQMSKSWEIRTRLDRGERSIALAEQMADCVAPWLALDAPWDLPGLERAGGAQPRVWSELLRPQLRSASVRELREFDLCSIDEAGFLSLLVRSLEAVVRRGLDLGRSIGWDEKEGLWKLGGLDRVSLAPTEAGREADPDYEGVGPSVKLLHAAVRRLVDIDLKAASIVVRRWLHTECPVHRRLWAAFAQDGRLATCSEVKEVLLHLKEHEVWLTDSYREIAELRVHRFREFDTETQEALLSRLCNGPRTDRWADVDQELLMAWSREVAVREMRRIRDEGNSLPAQVDEWLQSTLAEHPELSVDSSEHGQSQEGESRVRPAGPDLDRHSGSTLLAELEHGLASEAPFYDGSVGSWVGQRTSEVLVAMAEQTDSGLDLPHLWKALGLRHVPPSVDGQGVEAREGGVEAEQVVALLGKVGDETLRQVAEPLSYWWMRWAGMVSPGRAVWHAWLRLWLHTVDSTNATEDGVPSDYDLLNTPAGRLASAVLPLTREVDRDRRSTEHAELSRMLASIVEASGEARLLGLAHLVRGVPWLLRVDQAWTEEHLIPALKERSDSALFLWESLCRYGLRAGIPESLVEDAIELAEGRAEPALSERSRQRLLSTFVGDALWASLRDREPVLEPVQLQQLLRRLSAELRTHCAAELWRSLVNLGDDAPSPEEVFRNAVAPFLKDVWPQDLNLVSRGPSRFMAGIPAASRSEFSTAVDAVARFLVPGSTVSRHGYGLHGEEDGVEVLELIVDSPERASALLRLLDLTVGGGEDVLTPLGLDELLARIRDVAPTLVERSEFVRLATLAQRSRFE